MIILFMQNTFLTKAQILLSSYILFSNENIACASSRVQESPTNLKKIIF